MSLTLDPQTEQRIQQALVDSDLKSPDELVNHALDLMNEDSERQQRAAFSAFLNQRWEESQSGDPGIPGEQIEAMLADRRVKRIA